MNFELKYKLLKERIIPTHFNIRLQLLFQEFIKRLRGKIF